MKMHDVVIDVSSWLKIAHETTNPSEDELNARFEEAWQAKGATDHGYAADYRRIGRRLIDYLVKTRNSGARIPVKPITLSLVDGEIAIVPDSISTGNPGQTVVRRVKTGRPRSNGFDDIEFTLLHLAVAQAFGVQASVEVTYLTSEITSPMTISPRKLESRREKVQEILGSIRAGDFPRIPDARVCPRCPCLFICGDLPGGTFTARRAKQPFRS
jgi:hypothetical protein